MEEAHVYLFKNRKFSDFYLCFCGYAKCEPLHSFGPAVRPNYLMHIITEGRGKYSVDGKQYELKAGQGFLIEPEVQTFYQADSEDPWSYMWIGFSGARAKEYLSDLGLGGGNLTFDCHHMAELKAMLQNIVKRNTYTIENEFLRESFLYQTFAVLSRSLNIQKLSGNERNTDNIYVKQAVEFIQNNYLDPIRVSDIADYVGISRGYLHKLFLELLSQSPQDYLISCRMTRGAELLSVTELSIEEIALSCGYTDPLAFSKIFKRNTGMTPRQYRKDNWSK